MSLQKFDKNYKRLAILIDPEKFEATHGILEQIKIHRPDFIFIGGSSSIEISLFKNCITFFKENTSIPVIIFPGDNDQISETADGILILSILQSNQASLISGKLTAVAEKIALSSLETIATSYILIDGGKSSSTELFTKVTPIVPSDLSKIKAIFHTSNILNYQATYLEAGSGAVRPIGIDIISLAKITMPKQILIVGGGIRTEIDAEKAWIHGADIVVVGNHLETHPNALRAFCSKRNELNKG